jgi:hypothetical protein
MTKQQAHAVYNGKTLAGSITIGEKGFSLRSTPTISGLVCTARRRAACRDRSGTERKRAMMTTVHNMSTLERQLENR